MRQSNLLILNTLITYVRMALTVGLGLLATRLLLRALGFVDFGIVAALGATGALLAIVSDSLTSSAQRNMAFEIGRRDNERLGIVFNTSLAVFCMAGILIALLGVALANVVLSTLQIPESRADAAWWAYHLTLANLAVTMLAVPFSAIIDAHQAMVVSASRDFLLSLFQLAAVAALLWAPGDRLINYAMLLLVSRLLIYLLFVAVAIRLFPASRPRIGLIRRGEVRGIMSFAGWASLGSLGWQLRMQGSVVLLNVCFGPVVNAAYAIATQVGGYQGSLGGAVSVAARSATVVVHASGAGEALKSLVLATGKYTCLSMLFLLIPVQIEVAALLKAWLGNYPEMTETFVRLAMVWVALLALGAGYHLAALALGKLARYTLMMSSFDMAVLLLGAVGFFLLDWPPVSLLVGAVVLTAVQVTMQARFVGSQIGLSLGAWFSRLVRPVALVLAAGLAPALLIHWLLPAGLIRVALVFMAAAISLTPAIWLVALERPEYERLGGILSDVVRRVKRLVSAGTGTDRSEATP